MFSFSRFFKIIVLLLFIGPIIAFFFKGSFIDSSKKSDYLLKTHYQKVSNKPEKLTSPQDNEKASSNQSLNNTSDLNYLLGKLIVPTNKEYTFIEFSAFFNKWMSKEPKHVMNYLLNINEDDFQLLMLQLAMLAWSNINSNAFNDWLLLVEPSDLLDNALFELCQMDNLPSSLSIKYAERINDFYIQEVSIEKSIQKWIKLDMINVFKWVSQSSDTYQKYGDKVYTLAIESNIELALSSLYLLSEDDPSLSATIVNKMSEKVFELVHQDGLNADNIASILLTLDSNKFNDTLIQSIVPIILPYSNTEIMVTLIDQIPRGEKRNMIEQKMVGILMNKDIPAVLEFINYFDTDDMRQQALNTITNKWAEQDLLAASDWLSTIDIGTSNAGYSLAQIAVRQKNIGIAKKWVKEVEKTHDIDQIHYAIFNLLYQKDIDSAEDYLNSETSFSKDEISIILNDAESRNIKAENQ